MKSAHFPRNRALAIAGGVSVVALAAGGVAYATTPSTPAPAANTPAATVAATAKLGLGAYRPLVRLARHTVHAQLIVKTKNGYETVIVNKGTLEKVSATSITLKRPDGPVITTYISSSTRFRGLPESELAAGDRVVTVQIGRTDILVGALPPKSSVSAAS
jgi:hypothetical protein